MFKSAMRELEIDPAKLPLGALSQTQLSRGYDSLNELKDAVARGAGAAELQRLSSAFYTTIPHSFGRSAPPTIGTAEAVQKKFDMLNTLADIEAAHAMSSNGGAAAAAAGGPRPHPSDVNFGALNADLEPLAHGDPELDMIETYYQKTKANFQSWPLAQVFRVNRHGEAARFGAHTALANRRLLWHGTNAAVVAAILKSGLRIMPHSGGRVGRGIYLADQHQKSAGYCQAGARKIVMFLVEAALGTEHKITTDDPSLKAAPPGTHSVVARGRMVPDPKEDVDLVLDGKNVAVPQGAPIATNEPATRFQHNEFLVYKESQHRIRYVLVFNI